MPNSLAPDIQQLMQQAMNVGQYHSEEELLRDALLAWHERHDDLAAISAGIADMEAGRVTDIEVVARELRERHGFVDR